MYGVCLRLVFPVLPGFWLRLFSPRYKIEASFALPKPRKLRIQWKDFVQKNSLHKLTRCWGRVKVGFILQSLLQCSTTLFPVEFWFPCSIFLQNFFFLVHATVSHTLLCISRMWQSLFALFFGQRNWKVRLRERNKKNSFQPSILSRERELLKLI